jgi:hypothetical protein
MIKDSLNNKIKIPENLDKFFYDYDHSIFLECNYELVKKNTQFSNGTYQQDIKKNDRIKPCFLYIAQQLESMYKHYWLSSGTLLGKNNRFITQPHL